MRREDHRLSRLLLYDRMVGRDADLLLWVDDNVEIRTGRKNIRKPLYSLDAIEIGSRELYGDLARESARELEHILVRHYWRVIGN